jgi:hypothetical protein
LPSPIVDSGEDLWHAYNLIREGDKVEANTFRKIQTNRGTGSESERIKLKLMIVVEGVEYDAEGEHAWHISRSLSCIDARSAERDRICVLCYRFRRPKRPPASGTHIVPCAGPTSFRPQGSRSA